VLEEEGAHIWREASNQDGKIDKEDNKDIEEKELFIVMS